MRIKDLSCRIRTNTSALALAASLGTLLIGSVAIVPNASAADPDPTSYMSIYSARGTYTRAEITITPASAAGTHRCGGRFGTQAGSSSNTLTVKLYKGSPHTIRCDAVGGGTHYMVKFLKGKASGVASDYQLLPSGSSAYSAIDTNNNVTVSPYKSCAYVHPIPVGFSPGISQVSYDNTGSCQKQTDPVPQDTATLTTNLLSTTNVTANAGPKGTIVLADASAWDGQLVAGKVPCTGSITVTYTRTDDGSNKVQGPYSKRMTSKAGKCVAKLTHDKAKFAHKTKNVTPTYTLKAQFVGTSYFTAATATDKSFTTK